MVGEIVLRAAREHEAAALTDLAVRSASHWGGDPAELATDRSFILQPHEVTARRVTVAERDGRVLGFYTLEGQPPYAEIGMFYVEPAMIGTGVGRRMWTHLRQAAQRLGIRDLATGAEPKAEGFYLKMGMRRDRLIWHEGSRMPWLVYHIPPTE